MNRGLDLRPRLRDRTEPPGLPHNTLWRGRLADQLTAATAYPVTLMSAGPGWGKTTAAASWAASGTAHHPVAWLGLDETDNNPRSFWSNLMSALVTRWAVRDRSPLRGHNPGDPFEDADLHEFWRQLADLQAPVVLVIDDFDVITDDAVLLAFAQADPVLPLHALRARGDLIEIRGTDLRFTPDETVQLLTGHSLHLRVDQVGRVLDRAAGWPAGIRAAALSIDPHDVEAGINRFCRANRAGADYLVADVLRTMTSTDRDFLLATSRTEMLNSDLADQLTGRSDSQLVLERLFEGGVFTITRGHHGWYSYQSMFRYLLTQLPNAASQGSARSSAELIPVAPRTIP
jgi:LuxR family maltose regulon positive regulatory protein